MNTPVKSVGKRTLFVTPNKDENYKRCDVKNTPEKFANIPCSVLCENAYAANACVQTVMSLLSNSCLVSLCTETV